MEIGEDNSWLRPVDPTNRARQGHRDPHAPHLPPHIGTYRGTGQDGLNVPNPQPGYAYEWGKPPSPGASDVGWFSQMRDGYEPVTIDQPEGYFCREFSFNTDLRSKPTGAYVQYGSLVLLRIPIERYNRIASERQPNLTRFDDMREDYLARGRERSRELSELGLDYSRDAYFVRSNHGVRREDTPIG